MMNTIPFSKQSANYSAIYIYETLFLIVKSKEWKQNKFLVGDIPANTGRLFDNNNTIQGNQRRNALEHHNT